MMQTESLAKAFSSSSLVNVVAAKALESVGAVWNREHQCWRFPDGSCGSFNGETKIGPRFEECKHDVVSADG